MLILRFYSKVQNVFDAFRRFGEKLSKALLSLLVFGIVWSITICTFSWIGYMVFGDVIYQVILETFVHFYSFTFSQVNFFSV